jgi:hypothetical protein
VGSAPASRNSSGSASIDQSWIASGKLQPVFQNQLSLDMQGRFMVYPARHASGPEVKCFVAWLPEEAWH